MRDQLSANLHPLSDRLLMFYYNHTLISWDGHRWFYMTPYGPSPYEETIRSFADDFGAMIHDSSGETWVTVDFLFWIPADYLFETDDLEMVPSMGDILAIKDKSSNQIRYVSTGSYLPEVLNVPYAPHLVDFIKRYDDGRFMIHANNAHYGSVDGGDNWFKLHSWFDIGDGMRVSGKGGWASGSFFSRRTVIVSKDLWDWELISIPSGRSLVTHVFFKNRHYAIFMVSAEGNDRFLYVSEDGIDWRRVSDRLDVSWPRLVPFRDSLFMQDTTPEGKLAYVETSPREMSEQEIETRFHFLGFQGDDFPAFTAVENGWIWGPELGWVYPGGPGYPYFYFWSERHDGWLFVDYYDPDYWYSYRDQTWGYLSRAHRGDPWLPMPRALQAQ